MATTQTETMFGDMAVAVNPKDSRYKKFIGQYITLPFVGRRFQLLVMSMLTWNLVLAALKITLAMTSMIMKLGKNLLCMR
ncbi:MAG: hypothetical protein CM15mP12_8700 [Gammaproteobacteria bacterium]|nr:MAG: hypothetical protein CM15mP12_8700 [Gammaproteobacteria bacterium]